MNITSNRGMYAEAMINRTIAYYHSKKIALIEKRYCPFQLTKNLANNSFIGRLLSKSGADYYGIYQGKHLEFEVKQVQEESFNLANIAKHQGESLNIGSQYGAICFFVVHFFQYDHFFVIPFKDLGQKYCQKQKSGSYQDIKKQYQPLEIQYPGIIDFLGQI